MNFDQIENILLTAAIARVLGWAGAVLATVGVTVKFDDGSAAQIATVIVGLLGMLTHYLISKRNLKKAANLPPPPIVTLSRPSTPESVSTAPIQ